MFTPQLPAHQLLSHATSLHRSGRFQQAIEVYRQLLRQFPNNPEIMAKLGSALTSVGMLEEGRRHLERAIKLAPDQAVLHHDLHLSYKREGRFKDAHACLDKALKLAPRHPSYLAARSELHFVVGDSDKAMQSITPVLGQAPEVSAVALMFAALAPQFGREQEALEALKSLLARTDLTPAVRAKAQFAYGHLLDLVGREDEAFAALTVANQLKNATWDSDKHQQAVDETIAAWTMDAMAAMPRSSTDGSSMVFVVGMPRSAEWAVERVIASLPGGQPMGEVGDAVLLARDLQGGAQAGLPMFNKVAALTPEMLDAAAKRYLERSRRLNGAAKRFVDRMPLNFANLGLISRMLPGARVIHCTQDPVNSCLSCWFTLFGGNLPFAYDLHTLGRFHRQYERLMDNWKRTLDIPILEVSFEDLVERHGDTARRIAEFVELPWSDGALSPTGRSEQADENAHSALVRTLGRAKRYERHLAPLREGLGV